MPVGCSHPLHDDPRWTEAQTPTARRQEKADCTSFPSSGVSVSVSPRTCAGASQQSEAGGYPWTFYLFGLPFSWAEGKKLDLWAGETLGS